MRAALFARRLFIVVGSRFDFAQARVGVRRKLLVHWRGLIRPSNPPCRWLTLQPPCVRPLRQFGLLMAKDLVEVAHRPKVAGRPSVWTQGDKSRRQPLSLLL
jgi:hypothetical protein